MGYYTSFEYAQDDSEATLEEFAAAELAHFGDLSHGYDLGSGYAHGKWYDFDDDMCGISRLLPGKLIVVDGSGEDDGDVWRAFFRDGKEIDCVKRPTWVRPTAPPSETTQTA